MHSETKIGVHVAHPHAQEAPQSILRQPKAVWAVAFACIIAFMGLGLVDPILPKLAYQLHAAKSQVELLFTSYNAVTGVAMVVTGAISSRIGPKKTLLTGLFLIVLFSALGGFSASIIPDQWLGQTWLSTINQIAWFRGGWGLGNAMFIATALAVIVNVASGGTARAIIVYEAALGLGISVGPLLGGELGSISWRGPFFGVAILMAIAFIAIAILLPPIAKPAQRSSVMDPFRALRYRGLLTMALTALLYNFGFFTLLAYTPFVLPHLSTHGLGYVFFGWGVLLAITSVFLAPVLQTRFGTVPTMYTMLLLIALDLLCMGIFTNTEAVIVSCVVLAGGFLGVNNTLVTTAVMEVTPVERSVASAAYSFVRFIGGAIAPWLAGKLSEWYNPHTPFFVGAIAVVLSILMLFSGRSALRSV